ncbi:ABA4-like family protein [Antarcticirhabdus aurantiaca]|uniref:ABA4-like family protein n=1 Tax=Antarcticirhabdus aurantiaca TaxID=2606717 RepID=A0ACD4NSF0_9HYPH|nr:ABA4-like family protein [Antarcticirhabdus aurantiaca]WAJ29806.1 ABA4-like family protein [Jeongeuplla avenae]
MAAILLVTIPEATRMTLETIFSLCGLLALIGWAALLASPWIPVWSDRIAGWIVPGLLAVIYVALVLAFFGEAEGGFGSLEEVAQLFSSRPVLLAGWLHYLAFDLLVGAWEAREGRRRGVPFLLVVPCFAATFLVGPAGFLLFLVVRAAAGRRAVASAA